MWFKITPRAKAKDIAKDQCNPSTVPLGVCSKDLWPAEHPRDIGSKPVSKSRRQQQRSPEEIVQQQGFVDDGISNYSCLSNFQLLDFWIPSVIVTIAAFVHPSLSYTLHISSRSTDCRQRQSVLLTFQVSDFQTFVLPPSFSRLLPVYTCASKSIIYLAQISSSFTERFQNLNRKPLAERQTNCKFSLFGTSVNRSLVTTECRAIPQ